MQLLGHVTLGVRNTLGRPRISTFSFHIRYDAKPDGETHLKIHAQLLYNSLPLDKALDEDAGGLEVARPNTRCIRQVHGTISAYTKTDPNPGTPGVVIERTPVLGSRPRLSTIRDMRVSHAPKSCGVGRRHSGHAHCLLKGEVKAAPSQPRCEQHRFGAYTIAVGGAGEEKRTVQARTRAWTKVRRTRVVPEPPSVKVKSTCSNNLLGNLG